MLYTVANILSEGTGLPTPTNYSVQKAFAILQAFRPSDGWLTCAELRRRVGIPEATVYRLLETMVDIGAARRGDHGGYRPGPLLSSLSKAASKDRFDAIAPGILSDLSNRLNVTTHWARLEDGMVRYIAKATTQDSCEVQTFPGAEFEPYGSASGKVLLSALTRNALESFLLDGELIPLTPYTITESGALMAEFDKVRCRGYALDNREFHPRIACVAVPVLDEEGQQVAVISASEHADRMSSDRRRFLLKALSLASRKIGARSPRIRPLRRPASQVATVA